MRIAGFIKTSFVDYPGKIAAVVFTGGCNLNCIYCHNRHIIDNTSETQAYSWEHVLSHIKKRRGLIDGVVISGGEPTIQKGLIPFMEKIKSLGYLIKLDTNGTNPHVLEEIVQKGLADYISMDLKSPFDKYDMICGCKVECRKISKSMELLKGCGVDHEYRTTLFGLLDADDVLNMAGMAGEDKKSAYIVQKCRETEGFSHKLCIGEEQWKLSYLPKLEGKISGRIAARGFSK